MKAVIRVWWTFFSAFRVQRVLAIVGVLMCALFVAAGVVARQPFWMLGPLALFLFLLFPATFASAGIFRALSATRMHQLLPRFRVRMLWALGLLVLSVLVPFVVIGAAFGVGAFVVGSAELVRFALLLLVWPFVWLTAGFLLLFLWSGNFRWGVAFPAVVLTLGALGETARTALASASLLWLAAAVLAWAVFAAWYLRVRTIGPVAFIPLRQIGASHRVESDGPQGRDAAIRALLAARPPPSIRDLLAVVGTALAAVIFLVAVTPATRMFAFTSFVWPFAFMGIVGALAARTVHRSRLLWLHVPGARQDVRRIVERSLWRTWAMTLPFLALVAALYASPLGGATAMELLGGVALAAAAAVYGAYVMFAAVPSVATQICGFGLMGAAYLALLWRAAPSPPVVVALTAAAIVGALLLRALALRRWESIDWLRVRPIAGMAGALQ